MLIRRKSDSGVQRVRGNAVAVVVAAVLVAAATAPAAGATATPIPHDMWNTRRTLNVSHAGGDLEAPHSTLFAMKEAVRNGADVLEMDVRLSADGVLMIHHDDTVDRTTNNTGDVANYTAAQLQAMDNAYWFYPDCWSCHSQPSSDYQYRGVRTGAVAPPVGYTADDFGIATLAQVAAAFPSRTLDVEIKAGPTAIAATEALAAFINTHGPPDRFLVVSFDDTLTDYFKTLAPDVPTSPGQSATIDWFVNRGPMPQHRVLQVPPTFSGIDVVTQQFVDDAHANGLAVWVWFNGNEEENPVMWQSLIDLGVDALLTGKPRQAQALIDANSTAFVVPPTIGPVASVAAHSLAVNYSCAASHIARCESLVVLISLNRHGRYEILGSGWAAAPRGTSSRVHITLTRFGQRSLRQAPFSGVAGAWSANSDTEHHIAVVTARRS